MKKFLLTAILLMITTPPLFAATVKVFGGRGLVGVFGHYSQSNTGTTYSGGQSGNHFDYAYVTLTNYFYGYHQCSTRNTLEIDGVRGVKISNDLMLVPEFTFVDHRVTTGGTSTIPVDTVTGHFNGWGSGTNQRPGQTSWCLWSPLQSSPVLTMKHSVTMTGRLLIYGTGNQTSGRYFLNEDFGFSIKDSRDNNSAGAWKSLVSKSEPIDITVSGLTCNLQTDSIVSFGIQDANASAGTKLATVQKPMTISCSQIKDQTDAYIGITAGVLPQYYSGSALEVNLIDAARRPAAYAKVYVNNGNTRQPLRFDNVMLDLGSISKFQNALTIASTLEYELYSRGLGIAGKFTGIAELSVIMR